MKEREFNGTNTRPAKAGLVFPFIVSFFLTCLYVLLPNYALAQWNLILTSPYDGISVANFSFIYFLDQVGHPEIGFTGGEGGTIFQNDTGFLFRTSDGGATWTKPSFTPADFWDSAGRQWNSWWWFEDMVFKDSLTGWMVAIYGDTAGGCFRTTDGGLSWTFLNQSGSQLLANDPGSVYYDSLSKGLFTLGENWQLVSWDEGNTWNKSVSTGSILYGYAFASDSEGILHDTYKTIDGGKTWLISGSCDSDFMQPVAIAGTQTYLAVTWDGNVLRTDDMWDTWRVVSQIPTVGFLDSSVVRTTGCIQGSAKFLIAQSAVGCFISRDTGTTWESLCGPSENYLSWAAGGTQRFYVSDSQIYVQTVNIEPSAVTQIWMLNLDSLNLITSNFAEQFPDGSKRTSVSAGSNVTVNYVPHTDTLVGIDSVMLAIHYDSASLSLTGIKIPSPWSILDSSLRGNVLYLLLTDTSAEPLPSPILQLQFGTFLTGESRAGGTDPSASSGQALCAMVYLDSAHLYGHRLNCDCAVQSILSADTSTLMASAIDSVEIDFTGCGDSILLAAMQGKLPLVIDGIIPNPFSQSTQISFISPEAGYADISIVNLLGEQVARIFSGELDAGSHSFTFSNTTALPDGTYECLIRMNGQVETLPVVLIR